MIKLQVTATPHATHRPPAPTNSRYTSYRKTTTPRSSQHTTNPQQINLSVREKKSVKRNRLSDLLSPSRAARTSPLIVVAQNTSML